MKKLKYVVLSALALVGMVGCGEEVLPQYSINFALEDGTVIQNKLYTKGEVPVFEGDNPTKAEDNDGVYTFKGWSSSYGGEVSEPVAASEPTTYYAVFETNPKYCVSFVDWDGSALKVDYLLSGATPVAPANPSREDGPEAHFDFSGWSPAIAPVANSNVVYYAQYNVTATREIRFVDEDGTLLDVQRVPLGSTPVYAGNEPTKPEDKEEQTGYSFAGWSPAIEAVTKDQVYVATYSEYETKEDWDAFEKYYLGQLSMYDIPFYKARMEFVTLDLDGNGYLELFGFASGRPVTDDEIYDYCDLMLDVDNSEMIAEIIAEFSAQDPANAAYYESVIPRIVPEYSYYEVIDGSVQDAGLFEEIGLEFVTAFRSNYNAIMAYDQVVAICTDKNGYLYVLSTICYSSRSLYSDITGPIDYREDGYADGAYYASYDYYWIEAFANDLSDVMAGLDYEEYDPEAEDGEGAYVPVMNPINSAFYATEYEWGEEVWFEFSEISYCNPFTYGNLYWDSYFSPQLELDYYGVTSEEVNGYLNNLVANGFEIMDAGDGYYMFGKLIVVMDEIPEGATPEEIEEIEANAEYYIAVVSCGFIEAASAEEENCFWVSYQVLTF